MKYNVNIQFYATCLALIVLCASLLLTSCNASMLGADMDSVSPDTIIIAPPPIHHVIIENIEILEVPARTPNGDHWDEFGSQNSGPDLAIQLRAIGEEVSGVSEFLNDSSNDQYDDYESLVAWGTCVAQLTGASLSEGDLPFYIPLNFHGFLEVVDRDFIFNGLGGFQEMFNDLMTSFEFTPVDYQEAAPHVILLTSQDHCRYSIRLQVRWI